jgi:hypothetical protein
MQTITYAHDRTHIRILIAPLVYQIIKINKTQILLKYFFGARGVKFLEKRRENVQILQALR